MLSVEITTQQVQLCVSSETKGWVLVLPWSRDQCGLSINLTTLLAEHQFNVVNDGLDDKLHSLQTSAGALIIEGVTLTVDTQ